MCWAVPFGEAEHSGVSAIGQQGILKNFIFFEIHLKTIAYTSILRPKKTKANESFLSFAQKKIPVVMKMTSEKWINSP